MNSNKSMHPIMYKNIYFFAKIKTPVFSKQHFAIYAGLLEQQRIVCEDNFRYHDNLTISLSILVSNVSKLSVHASTPCILFIFLFFFNIYFTIYHNYHQFMW